MHAQCLDLDAANISGGTNPNKELYERKIILKYQQCKDFMADTSVCATADEEAAFFK